MKRRKPRPLKPYGNAPAKCIVHTAQALTILKEAVTAIYLYRTHAEKLGHALHRIVRELDPGLAELLAENPSAASEKLTPEAFC